MDKDYFEDRTTFEDRYCKRCNSVYQHRILSRWGVPAEKGRKNKIPASEWIFEREINAYCCKCYPFVDSGR